MSQYTFQKMWWRNPQEKKQQQGDYIKFGQKIYCHFALFEYLHTHKSKLVRFTYSADMLSGIAGPQTQVPRPSLLSIFFQHLQHERCQKGELGVWRLLDREKQTDLVLFLEIIDLSDTAQTKRRSDLTQLVAQYQSLVYSEKDLGFDSSSWRSSTTQLGLKIEDTELEKMEDELDQQDLEHYICRIFYSYWIGEDLTFITIIQAVATDKIVRRSLVMGYGIQALRNLAGLAEGYGEALWVERDRQLQRVYEAVNCEV